MHNLATYIHFDCNHHHGSSVLVFIHKLHRQLVDASHIYTVECYPLGYTEAITLRRLLHNFDCMRGKLDEMRTCVATNVGVRYIKICTHAHKVCLWQYVFREYEAKTLITTGLLTARLSQIRIYVPALTYITLKFSSNFMEGSLNGDIYV